MNSAVAVARNAQAKWAGDLSMLQNTSVLIGMIAIAMALQTGAAVVQTSEQDVAGAGRGTYAGDLQRSTQIYAFQQAAHSGIARGQESYYYRCWNYHNTNANANANANAVGVLHRCSKAFMGA